MLTGSDGRHLVRGVGGVWSKEKSQQTNPWMIGAVTLLVGMATVLLIVVGRRVYRRRACRKRGDSGYRNLPGVTFENEEHDSLVQSNTNERTPAVATGPNAGNVNYGSAYDSDIAAVTVISGTDRPSMV